MDVSRTIRKLDDLRWNVRIAPDDPDEMTPSDIVQSVNAIVDILQDILWTLEDVKQWR